MTDFHFFDHQVSQSSRALSAILDEPTASIDQIDQANVMEIVNESSQNIGDLDFFSITQQTLGMMYLCENPYQQYTPQDFFSQEDSVVNFQLNSVEVNPVSENIIFDPTIGNTRHSEVLSDNPTEDFNANQDDLSLESWIEKLVLSQEDEYITPMPIFQNHLSDTSTRQLMSSHSNQLQEPLGAQSIILLDQQHVNNLVISDSSKQNQIDVSSPLLSGNSLLDQSCHFNNHGPISQFFPFMQHQQQQSPVPLINFGIGPKEYFPIPGTSSSNQPALTVHPTTLFTGTSITTGNLDSSFQLYNLRDSRTCFTSSSIYNMVSSDFSSAASQLGSDSTTPSTTGAITPVLTLSSETFKSGAMSEADSFHLHQQLQAVQEVQAVQKVSEYSSDSALLPILTEVKNYQQNLICRSPLIQPDNSETMEPYRKRYRAQPRSFVHRDRKEFTLNNKRRVIDGNSGPINRSFVKPSIGDSPMNTHDKTPQDATIRTQAHISQGQHDLISSLGYPLIHRDNQTVTGVFSNSSQVLITFTGAEPLNDEPRLSSASDQNQEPGFPKNTLVTKKRTKDLNESIIENSTYNQILSENIAAHQASVIQAQRKQLDELKRKLSELQDLQKHQQSPIASQETLECKGQVDNHTSTSKVIISSPSPSLVHRRGRQPRANPYSKTGGRTTVSRRLSQKTSPPYENNSNHSESEHYLSLKDEVFSHSGEPENDYTNAIPSTENKDLELHSSSVSNDEHSYEGFPLPIKCTLPSCPRTFASLGLLKSHLVSHQKDKPYWCDICSYDGITPRPITDKSDIIRAMAAKSSRSKSQETTVSENTPSVLHYEVKRYKRNHDLLRHKREQHPPPEVKLQREAERAASRAARKKRNEVQRKEKANTRSKSRSSKAESSNLPNKTRTKDHADVAAIVQNYLNQYNVLSSAYLEDEIGTSSESEYDAKDALTTRTRYRRKKTSDTLNSTSKQVFGGHSSRNQLQSGCANRDMGSNSNKALGDCNFLECSDCETFEGEVSDIVSSTSSCPKRDNEEIFSDDEDDYSDDEDDMEMDQQGTNFGNFNSPSTTLLNTFEYLSSIDGAIDSTCSDVSDGEISDDDDDDEYRPSIPQKGHNTKV